MNLGFAKWVDRWVGRLICSVLSAGRMLREMVAARDTTVGEPRRILLIKFWGLGNLVLLLPVIRALRERYPDARIRLVTLARNRELVEGVEDLDGLLLVSDRGFLAVVWTYLARLWGARRFRPDIVVDFEQFARASAIFAFLTGAPQTVGIDMPGQGRGRMFHARVPYDDHRHSAETFLDLARAAGAVPVRWVPLPPPVNDADRAEMRALLAEAGAADGPIWVLHPGSGDNFEGRRWGTRSFAALADHLVTTHGGTAVLTGSGGEREVTAAVRAASTRPGQVFDAAGRIGVRALVALCERADLVVSNDTAPVHIASSLGRPVLGIYGPNTPRLYGPRSPGSVAFYHRTPCSPCLTNFNYKTSLCRMPVCIRSITVEEVAAAADRVVERARSGREPAPAQVLVRDVPGPEGGS